MRSKESLDERQLMIRGNAFKYGFFTLLVLLAAEAFLTGVCGLAVMEGIWGNVLIIVAGAIAAASSMLRRGYYDFDRRENRLIWYVFAAGGLFLALLSLLDLAKGDFTLAGPALISDDAIHALIALGWLYLGGLGIAKSRAYTQANPPD